MSDRHGFGLIAFDKKGDEGEYSGVSGIKLWEILGEGWLAEILKGKSGCRNPPKPTLCWGWQLAENSGDHDQKLYLIWAFMEGFKKPGSSRVGSLKKQTENHLSLLSLAYIYIYILNTEILQPVKLWLTFVPYFSMSSIGSSVSSLFACLRL